MRFDFDSETRRRLGHRLIDQIDAFFSSLPDRAVQLPLEQRSYGPTHHPLIGVLAEGLVAGLNPQLATLARSQLASKIEL